MSVNEPLHAGVSQGVRTRARHGNACLVQVITCPAGDRVVGHGCQRGQDSIEDVPVRFSRPAVFQVIHYGLPDDWRQLYRVAGAPAPKIGDMGEGMEQDESGEWIGITAPVLAVGLAETRPDGSRFYRIWLGASVRVEDQK